MSKIKELGSDDQGLTNIPLPAAALHLYPEDDDGRYTPCYTPSAQGVYRRHQPYYTAEQMRKYALVANADIVQKARLALQRIDEWKSALTEDELIWMGHIDVAVQGLRQALGKTK